MLHIKKKGNAEIIFSLMLSLLFYVNLEQMIFYLHVNKCDFTSQTKQSLQFGQ